LKDGSRGQVCHEQVAVVIDGYAAGEQEK